jgi:hypothetical protein
MGQDGQTPEDRTVRRGKGRPKGSKNRKPKTPDNPPQIPTLYQRFPSRPDQTHQSPSLPPNIPKANSSTITETKRFHALRGKAEAALETLVSDTSCPPNVRAAAARTLLELVGAIGAKAPKHEADQGLDDGGLEPESLSLADIDRELRRLVT